MLVPGTGVPAASAAALTAAAAPAAAARNGRRLPRTLLFAPASPATAVVLASNAAATAA